MIKSYLIGVKPIALARARVNTKGKVPYFYNSQQHDIVSYGLLLQQQHGTDPLFSGPIDVSITFFMSKPTDFKKKNSPIYHCSRPDIDNLCKFLFDACNETVFTDDAIISKLSVEKIYDSTPRTQLTIKDLT